MLPDDENKAWEVSIKKWEEGLRKVEEGPEAFREWWIKKGGTRCSLCKYYKSCANCPLAIPYGDGPSTAFQSLSNYMGEVSLVPSADVLRRKVKAMLEHIKETWDLLEDGGFDNVRY